MQDLRNFQNTELNEFGQRVGAKVAPLSMSNTLPARLAASQVKLRHLNAVDLTQSDIDQLWQAVQAEPDARCWTYLPYAGFADREALAASLRANFDFEGAVHYLIEVNDRVLGWVALLNPRPQARVIEIGNVYFSSLMKQSTAATATIYLLLQHCFARGDRRVEWKCDELNLPSYRAALRYGFEYEGTFRQDRISKGRNRNTAWFSILDEEWITLQKAYQAWLAVDNFDQQGQQKLRLSDCMELYKMA